MNSQAYLRFLRPYLYRIAPARAAVYTRFSSISSRGLVQGRDLANSGSRKSPCTRRLHVVAAKRAAGSHSDAPSTVPTTTAAVRQVVVDSRVQKLKQCGALHYPRLGDRPNRISIPGFRERYRDESSTPAEEIVLLEGRVMSVRRSASKLVFLTILGQYQQVQVMISLSSIAEPKPTPQQFKDALHPYLRGDIVSVTGTAVRTKAGELTLKAINMPSLLAPGLAQLPEDLFNHETMVLNKHIDMLIHRRTSNIFRLRSHIIKAMRDFFHERDFLEVQTPILADYASGAAARPFLTSAAELHHKELALRIAPELWLKRLVVGGNDKVFEIGPAFRNEGIDTTHNPEFTICEFYSAYSNLSELISITEDFVTRLFQKTKRLVETEFESLEGPRMDLPEGNWEQVEFIPALEEVLGFKFPDLSLPDALPKLIELLDGRVKIEQGPELTLAKLLDDTAGQYLEPRSQEKPLFIIHHPACMAPLSKSFTCPKTGQLVSARAELFIKAREIANMYEEENDPFEQRRKFELQLASRSHQSGEANGDALEVDESYVRALEIGLPPTGGWGCGVDRLIMLLSGAPRIGETLSFGTLKNVVALRAAA
ncbi:lysyl-tRNA synthetase [Durotheca rogersii]|uniref:lysyl-tRNA synthetase n=1 Tax=Durotheca rogersii TaxID=419775 RepID=UPI00221EF3FD|nr:lysyl-tRNA synthetase [Durotheca rogersii]KAI5864735.1 lysyl-tRNA synthetase [Durotheca rogersii]